MSRISRSPVERLELGYWLNNLPIHLFTCHRPSAVTRKQTYGVLSVKFYRNNKLCSRINSLIAFHVLWCKNYLATHLHFGEKTGVFLSHYVHLKSRLAFFWVLSCCFNTDSNGFDWRWFD